MKLARSSAPSAGVGAVRSKSRLDRYQTTQWQKRPEPLGAVTWGIAKRPGSLEQQGPPTSDRPALRRENLAVATRMRAENREPTWRQRHASRRLRHYCAARIPGDEPQGKQARATQSVLGCSILPGSAQGQISRVPTLMHVGSRVPDAESAATIAAPCKTVSSRVECHTDLMHRATLRPERKV